MPAPAKSPGLPASYRNDWTLFSDYCAATSQSALPTSAATVERFLAALPAQPATRHRRLRAILAAHQHSGYDARHLARNPRPETTSVSRVSEAEAMIAACPSRGWPIGFTGRRDGFLAVLVEVLSHTHRQASRLEPAAITPTDDGLLIDSAPIPSCGDPRRCPACATVRWLQVCDLADGLGQAIAREILSTAHAPTATSPHTHLPRHQRWRHVPFLAVSIDQHGWLRETEPLSPRSISTRLATARAHARDLEAYG